MKRFALFALGLLIFSAGLYAHADTASPDPNWVVTDPTCSAEIESECPNPITDPNAVVSTILSANGGGIFTFTNLTDPQTHIDTIYAVTSGDIGVFNCASDAFHFCGSLYNSSTNTTEMIFSTQLLFEWEHPELFNATNDNGGLAYRDIFNFNFNGTDASQLGIPGDSGGWQAGQVINWSITAFPTTTTAVPEPASLLLTAAGFAGLLGWRRTRS